MRPNSLTDTASTFPYLQGLWTIPMGIMLFLAGVSNLEHGPSNAALIVIAVVALAAAVLTSITIDRYYRTNFGTVSPTRRNRIRQALAIVAWIVVLSVGANRHLLWSADSNLCIYASATALATIAYYAILVGLRRHHLVIWGALLVTGLLPIWGGLGVDRDAFAMFPIGIALVLSGLADQRLLARQLRQLTPAEPGEELLHGA